MLIRTRSRPSRRFEAVSHRRLPCLLMMSLAAACALPQYAGAQTQWVSEQAGVAQARNAKKPLVIFFTADERRNRRQEGNFLDKKREGVRSAFRDPAVGQLIQSVFIPVQTDIKTSKLGQHLKPQANEVIVASPDLVELARLRPLKSEGHDPAYVHQRLKQVAREYAAKTISRRCGPSCATRTPRRPNCAPH